MAGTWSGLKGTVPTAPVDQDSQARVNLKKGEFAGLSDADLARKYCELRDKKDALEAQVKDLNVAVEAAQQLIVASLEQAGVSSIRLDTGDAIFIKDTPYCSVEDQSKFLDFIEQSGQRSLLTVNYMTMSAMVKKRLEDGETTPPGIKVYLKTSLTRRRGR